MRPLILFLFFIFSNFSFAQQPLTTTQINRLADAGKGYGYIKYFHPFLQYKNINWDSAFASNVEGIIDAKNKEEYAAVMKRWFSTLNDNLTTVTSVLKSDSEYKIQLTTYNIKDSILYVNMNDATPENVWPIMGEALQNISKVKGVIFDMRSPLNSPYFNDTYGIGVGEDVLDWTTTYFKGDILKPSYRSIGYDANADAYFKVSGFRTRHGNANKEVPLAFIVSKEGEIPLIATVLQQKGKAAILQEGSRKLLPGCTANFYIQDSIFIRMRTGEAVNSEGSLLFVQPDDTWLTGEPSSIAITKAEKLILNGFQKEEKFNLYAPPPPIIRTSNYINQKYPSLGYRMLAAASIFSTIDHFLTDKNLIDKNWEASYKKMIPKFIEARDSLEYMQAVAELYANIADSHGYISNTADGFSLRLNPIIQGRGNFFPPVNTRVIENKVVVTGIYNDSVCRTIGIKKGDVVLSVNGKDAMQMVMDARKYQPASTKASQDFYVCSFILFGREGQIHKLKVLDKNGKIKHISMPTLSEFKGDFWPPDDYSYRLLSFYEHGPIKMLTDDVGYADLTKNLNKPDGDSIMNMLKKTKGFIFDLRGYPHIYFDLPFLFNTLTKNGKIPGWGKEITVAPTSPNIISILRNSVEQTNITTTYHDWSTNYKGWVYPGKRSGAHK